MSSSTTPTERVRALTARIPRGAWCSYGDLAAVLGLSARAVGGIMAHGAPHAHRVAYADGSHSPTFVRCEDSDTIAAGLRPPVGPLDLLRAEGVVIDEAERAHPSARLDRTELGLLAEGAQILPLD